MIARTFAALSMGLALLASPLALAHEVTTFSTFSSGSTVVTATGDGTVRIVGPRGTRHLPCPSGSIIEMHDEEIRIYPGYLRQGTVMSSVTVGGGTARARTMSSFVCP